MSAPQTTLYVSLPSVTVQTFNLSASGCFLADLTSPTTICSNALKSATTSDSNPCIVNLSASSDGEYSKSTKRLSHDRETFIKIAPKIAYHSDRIDEYL